MLKTGQGKQSTGRSSLAKLLMCQILTFTWRKFPFLKAPVTKYHRLGGLNKRHLTILVAGKSKIKVTADSVLGEGPFPGLQIAGFLLCSYVVERE